MTLEPHYSQGKTAGVVNDDAIQVLIAQSDPLYADSLKHAFESHPCRADTVFSFEQAMDALAQTDYQVAVIDSHLPGDGERLLETLAETAPDCVRVMITGDPRPELAVRWMNKGAAFSLRKPFDPEYLIGLCIHARRQPSLCQVEKLLEKRTRALQESERRYKELFYGSRDGYVMVDLTGRIIDANPSFCRILGYSLDELKSMKNFYELTPKRWQQWEQEEIWEKRLLGRGYSGVYEKEYIRKDGSRFPVELQSYAVFGPDGKPLYLWGVARDITDRKQTETTLRQSEEKYRNLIEGLNEGIWQIDARGYTTFVNPKMAKMLGYTTEAMKGKHLFAFMEERLAQEAKKRMEKRQAGISEQHEFTFTKKSGEPVFTLLSTSPVFDEQGGYAGALASIIDITESKKIQAALQESEHRFRSFVENANDIVYSLTPEGIFTYVSPNWLDFMGEPAENALGRSFEPYVHPEDLHLCRDFLQKVIRTGEKQSGVEYRVIHRNGSIVWHMSKGAPLYDESGNPIGYVGIARDVTDQKQKEAALRESEARYRCLTENFPNGALFLFDQSFRYLAANGKAFARAGLSSEQVVGKTVAEVFPDHWEFFRPFHQAALRGEESYYEVEYRGRLYSNQVVPVVEENGQIKQGIVIVHDITDRKQAEADRERLLMGIEQAGEIIVITDPEGTIQYANPAFERITGYSRQEAQGKNPRLLKSGKQGPAFYRRLWETISGGGTWEGRFVNRRKDGSLYTEEATISPVCDDQGRIINYVAVKRDISKDLEMEAEKAKLEAQFHQAQKLDSVGRLAGGVAHDLNNILSPILGYSEMLLEEFRMDGDLDRQSTLQEVVNAALRARDLVRQLLAFSRKQVLAFKSVDLNQVLAGFEKLLRRTIRENIAVRFFLAPELPLIRGDIGQLEQVIMNLAVNGQDAMPLGGELTLETRLIELDADYAASHQSVVPGWHVMLAVSDTGTGMDDETREHLFEPFFTTKAKDRGTGLGLATVYGIVKQHGGNIWVYSEPGRGTCFKLYFPVSQEADASEELAADLPENLHGSETILLAEDNPQVRALSHAILQRWGYTVLTAENGTGAMAALAEHDGPVDILLTDVIMPDMNGKELFERLSARHPGLKVLYMSGYTDNVIAHCGVLDAEINFIQKPFSVQSLAIKVRMVLDQGARI